MQVRVLGYDFVHLFAIGFLLCGFDGLGVLRFQILNFVVVFVEGDDHLSDTFNILKELIIDSFLALSLVMWL